MKYRSLSQSQRHAEASPSNRPETAGSIDGRPLPGIEFEELVGAVGPGPGRPRPKTLLLLGALAAVTGLGLGGRLIGHESLRNDDGIAAASAGTVPIATSGTASAPSTPSVAGVTAADPRRLPLGFAATPGAGGGRSSGTFVVTGFVAGAQSVHLRLIDPDGTVVLIVDVPSRAPAGGAAGLPWAFEALLVASTPVRTGGPDGRVLEIGWLDGTARYATMLPLLIGTAD